VHSCLSERHAKLPVVVIKLNDGVGVGDRACIGKTGVFKKGVAVSYSGYGRPDESRVIGVRNESSSYAQWNCPLALEEYTSRLGSAVPRDIDL
jgi:hypothetical protein